MFKQVSVFMVLAGHPRHDDLGDALQKVAFQPTAPSQELSYGWVPPRGKHEALFEVVGGEVIAKFAFEVKTVPADVLNRHVDSLVAAVESATGRKVGKKERSNLKDEAKLDLLPKAFPRRTEVFVWLSEGRLVIGSTSNTVVDAAVTSLVHLFDGYELAPLTTNASPGAAMSSWLYEQVAPIGFELGSSCELVSDVGKVKYTHHALEIEEVREHIVHGKQAANLALNHDDKVDFELTDELRLKKIKILDGVFDGPKDDFDGNVVMVTAVLGSLIDDLVVALGGVAE